MPNGLNSIEAAVVAVGLDERTHGCCRESVCVSERERGAGGCICV